MQNSRIVKMTRTGVTFKRPSTIKCPVPITDIEVSRFYTSGLHIKGPDPPFQG
jgi:hypothetical protein